MPPEDARELTRDDVSGADRIARRLARIYSHVEADDVISAARFGVVDAANRYIDQNGEFWAYAPKRICGEVKELARRTQHRTPGEDIPIEEWHGATGTRTEMCVMLRAILAQIDERDRTVLIEYYCHERSQREIAERLGLTTMRVSQIRHRAIASIRKNLQLAGEGARYH